MGTIEFNQTNIMGNAANTAQSQEVLQKALLRAGENNRRIAPPQMPSAPDDILGYPQSILSNPNPPVKTDETPGPETAPPPTDEIPDTTFSPEHESAGAVPGDDILTGG